MLRELERIYPGWNPLHRMVEMAELARDQMIEERKAYDAWQAASAANDSTASDEPPHRPTNADANLVQAMYERPAKYLLPQLKAQEITVGGLQGSGPVRVTFLREPPPEPEA